MKPPSFHDIFANAKEIRMTAQEKDLVRHNLLVFLRNHPVRSLGSARHRRQESWFYSFTRFAFKPIMIPLLLIVLLIAASGVSLAAEQALPGDLLYPVKFSVNEEAWSAIALSEQQQSLWQLERLERRLEESEKLAVRGNAQQGFDTEVYAELEGRFSAQAERVRQRIAMLESRSDAHAAAELSSNFEVALKVHERILARLAQDQTSGSQENISVLLGTVGDTGNAAALARKESELRIFGEANTDSSAAAEGRKKAAAQSIAEAEGFLKKWQGKHGTDATADAQARLNEARIIFAQGEAKLDAGSANEAFLLFQKAHRLAHEAKILIFAKNVLHVDVALGSDESATMSSNSNEHGGETEDAVGTGGHGTMVMDENGAGSGTSASGNSGAAGHQGDAKTDTDAGFHFRLPQIFQ